MKNVVNDGRSYSDLLFAKALALIQNANKNVNLSQEAHDKFETLVKKLFIMKQNIDDDDSLYEDAPDDFLDPLM